MVSFSTIQTKQNYKKHNRFSEILYWVKGKDIFAMWYLYNIKFFQNQKKKEN